VAVDRDKILQSAQKLVDKKKYDKAIVEYRKIVRDDPSDIRTLLKIGDLHRKLDQHEQAIETYEQVGNYYYREGFNVKAIAVYKQIRGIIKRHAPHLEGRYGHIVPRLAEIYTQLGLTSDALAAYDEVATRLRQEGRERDALDIFKKVVELDPQNPIAHLRVADSRARLGDMDKAVERFGEAAEIMVRLGRLDDALKVLERLLEYRQDPAWARRTAQLYLERGSANDGMAALTKLQVAFKADPKDLTTLGMLAQAFDVINQPKKALEVLKEAARVARDAGDEKAVHALLDELVKRAPEDTLVGKLDQWRRTQAARAEEVEVEVIEDAEIEVEESIEEVFELDEDDIVETGAGEAAAGSDLFAEPEGDSAVRRLVAEAERQRSAGHLQHAIQILRDGLRNLGGSHQIRHKLSDLLLEAGDQHASITEKLILAQEMANEGNVEDAVEMIDEVILIAPGHADAYQMRANLGFPMTGMPAPPIQDHPSVEVNQPLQSYDVESGGVEEALYRSRQQSAPNIAGLDDPFQDQAQAAQAYQQQRQQAYAQDATTTRVSFDENTLDYAEALANQGRYDEARHLLHEQLRAAPNHPLVLERLADIESIAQYSERGGHASHSGPYPVQGPPSQPIPLDGQQHYDPQAYDQQTYDQQAYDQQAYDQQAYDQHYGQGYSQHPPYSQPAPHSQYPPQEGYPAPEPYAGQEQAAAPQSGSQWASEVDSLLDQVREGVRNQVAESDAATHYDLGVAYYEMGLHSDAISELTLAARDPARECVCLSMIGNIQLQLGDLDAALDALHRALTAPYKTHEQECALGYEIANTYEYLGQPSEALRYFEWLASINADYEDPRGTVAERLHRLRSESGAVPRPGAPDYGDAKNS